MCLMDKTDCPNYLSLTFSLFVDHFNEEMAKDESERHLARSKFKLARAN